MNNLNKKIAYLEDIVHSSNSPSSSNDLLNIQLWRSELTAIEKQIRVFGSLGKQQFSRKQELLRLLDGVSLQYIDKGIDDIDANTNQGGFETNVPPAVKDLAMSKVDPRDSQAIIIGVGSYQHPELTDLPVTVQDADGVAKVLSDPAYCDYPFENVKLLTGTTANKEYILRALRELAMSSTKESRVFFYFSGHGARITDQDSRWYSFLCPWDTDPASFEDTAISEKELTEVFGKIRSERLLIVLDSCHAGGGVFLKGNNQVGDFKSGISEDSLDRLSQGAGRVVISSSKAEEKSYIVRGSTYSLFTTHFLNGLRGGASVRGDGLVRVLDLYHYVNEAVTREEPRQTPLLRVNDMDQNYPITLAARAKSKTTVAKQFEISKIRQNIINDPVAGAEDLRSYVFNEPSLEKYQLDVEFRRAELRRVLNELDLFGSQDPGLQAARARLVYQLLRMCLEIERSELH